MGKLSSFDDWTENFSKLMNPITHRVHGTGIFAYISLIFMVFM